MSIDFIYHPALVPGEDSPETNTLYFLDSQLLLKQEVIADPLNVTPWTTESIAMEPELQLLLGQVNGSPLRVVQLPQCPPGWQETGLRDYLLMSADDMFKVVNAAAQLRYWLSTQNFCSRCGTPLEFNDSDKALTCPGCEYRSYPKVSPCVISVVRDGRKLLLAQNLGFRNGMYSCLAGFIEAGESAEDALAREIEEEAGIQITNPRYLLSQAWPFPHQLMLGYLCDYAGGDLVIDETELRTAGWFDIDNLPELPPEKTLALTLIKEAVRVISAEEAS
ncbi:MAG: NAD(+) diphosphatase [Oceanospirillaceae bacterium]|uniref:NAD(+) diphosphatase n=1 Tax=unclassified Thalassolituus TaxID=2624967 RepID=UPI000C3A644E|nr:MULTISPECIES: NAD(+) diphosphatase [unclassified Thalassolituus]MAS25226.1 NAD(+) diphosphatase [Oceanospirillaceae bacterium]MAY00088.1 NAD(+) diphosphatase [Oceanospirillaceae bacterium]MBL33481.1 NAD(+) diphosphatase [Oceanospirillaceae bacterium]MBS51475.1 NAD(+) diphosphatase [Oceanospirillaceae bacterium]|tara:strand:- start:121 stop:954 length:834 start_codon:yes stop_codon:yes gene_type:complete